MVHTRDLRALQYGKQKEKDHYESYFLRSNAPDRPEALWIRFTILVSKHRPDQVIAERWCTHFDGAAGAVVTAKARYTLVPDDILSSATDLIRFREGGLSLAEVDGAIVGDPAMAWQLRYVSAGESPLVPYPADWMYRAPFPKSKVVTPEPKCRISGTLIIGARYIELTDWIGSLGHNWGSAHADRYAWAQSCAFVEDASACFEGAVAYLKVGPVALPPLAFFVLRAGGTEYRFDRYRSLVNRPRRLDAQNWEFQAFNGTHTLVGVIAGAEETFVALAYESPNGRTAICRNNCLADSQLRLYRGRNVDGPPLIELTSNHKTALELLGIA